jgi:hypothetical protein
MRKAFLLAAGLLAVLACPANALELKNARAAYGFLSSPRADDKYLPGDMLTYVYEIDDIQADPKTGIAYLQQTLQILDDKNKEVFKQVPMEMEIPLFGAKRMPSFVRAIMTFDQKPGKYVLKVTVTDKKAKETKGLTYDFQLLKEGFGIVQPFTPAVGFIDQQDFVINFSVTGMERDKKTKMPNVELSVRLLDKAGKPLVPEPVTSNVRDYHVKNAFDITQMRIIPTTLPLVLSQKGSFTIEVKATDRLAKNRTVTLLLPLTVVDATPYLKQALGGRPRE